MKVFGLLWCIFLLHLLIFGNLSIQTWRTFEVLPHFHSSLSVSTSVHLLCLTWFLPPSVSWKQLCWTVWRSCCCWSGKYMCHRWINEVHLKSGAWVSLKTKLSVSRSVRGNDLTMRQCGHNHFFEIQPWASVAHLLRMNLGLCVQCRCRKGVVKIFLINTLR